MRTYAPSSIEMDFDVGRFIHEIEKRPAIWNMKVKEYSDRIVKMKMWEEIVDLFGEKDMGVDEKKKMGLSVQKKWKNIRDNFVKEYRRKLAFKNGSGGPLLKQSYIYFNRLMFLKDVVESNTRGTASFAPTLQQSAEEKSSEEEDQTTRPNTTHKSPRKKKRKAASDTESDEVLEGTACDVKPTHSVATRWSSRVRQNSCLPVSNNSEESATKRHDSFTSEHSQDAARTPVEAGHSGSARVEIEDKFDAFGNNVAAKLRSLVNNEQRIYAEKLINDALFEAELGTLSRRSSIDVTSAAGCYFPEVECNVSSIDRNNLVEQL